jgi:threonine synthase
MGRRLMAERRRGDHFICTRCNAQYPLTAPIWQCNCGGLLAIRYEPRYDRRQIARLGPTLWRYRDALPLAKDTDAVSLGEGYTPIVYGRVGGVPVYLKQDHLFPSGSFKDRGAAVLVSQVAALGIQRVVEDSSGNAGAALAAYTARAGIACDIFVPDETSPAKLQQMRAYGATVYPVGGGRSGAEAAALQAARSSYYASHARNPFYIHGTKTFALEVWEQLGWKAPDTVVLPVGNGTLLLGTALGFDELAAASQIRSIPRLVAVQVEACAPIAAAFAQGDGAAASVSPQPTLAEGIAVAEPVRGAQILSAIRRTGGQVITVTEEEVAQALRAWWHLGYALEPTAAATLAGLARYVSESAAPGEAIVSAITGHGLKAMDRIATYLS